MKLSVKDFQIIKSASLEFIPGLTVITGESNNGKSALFRAAKSCIYNEPGTTAVRVGCKNYIVGIEYNNHKVIQQKGENSLYLIDGKQYNKVGKTQVPEVAEVLGISALNINDSTEKINFWDQMEKPFLLDRNSSDLFRFIVDSGEDDNLNNTLRSMVTDKNKLNTEKNLKEGSIATLKEQIDSMNNLLALSTEKIELCENVISFGPKPALLLTTETNITNINNTDSTIKQLTNTINEERRVKEELTNSVNTLSYNISRKAQIKDILDKHKALSTEIATIKAALANKVDFKTIIPNLDKLLTTKQKLSDTVAKISSVSSFIKDNKVTRIANTISTDDINKLSALKAVVTRLTTLNSIVANAKQTKLQLDNDYKAVIDEYNKMEICPYCGNKLHTGKEVT